VVAVNDIQFESGYQTVIKGGNRNSCREINWLRQRKAAVAEYKRLLVLVIILLRKNENVMSEFCQGFAQSAHGARNTADNRQVSVCKMSYVQITLLPIGNVPQSYFQKYLKPVAPGKAQCFLL